MKYLILFALTLSACTTMRTSEVVPAGKDSYMVTASSSGGRVGGEGPVAMQAANAYCEKLGKRALIRHTEPRNNFEFSSETLVFSCLDASDPEYKRPDLSTP